jgi:D-alanyl-D-alanine carboxypeptidase/D-alanyl-D-alanine-endopeptidase (penicillin-binding protein 4)
MLLREVGLRQRGVGSYQAGLATLREFLSKKVGLRKGEFTLLDASGLSRGNLVSPAATVKLLVHMWKSPGKEVFLSSLPISGEDGTLDWRFSRTSARGKIRAKTGTLAHVTAIAGYVSTADQYNLAFSIMVNNYGVQASYIRNLVDKICVVLSESKIEGDNDDNKQY